MSCEKFADDPQAPLVYGAERGLDKVLLDRCDLEGFMDQFTSCYVWKAYGELVPVLRFVNGDAKNPATSSWRDGTISLPPWARSRLVLLHELAHQLVHRFCPATGFEIEPHGPVYVWYYTSLVEAAAPDLIEPLRHALLCMGVKSALTGAPSRSIGYDIRRRAPDGSVASETWITDAFAFGQLQLPVTIRDLRTEGYARLTERTK